MSRLIERMSALAGNNQMQQMQALMASMAGGSAGATAAPKSDKKVKVDVKAKLEN